MKNFAKASAPSGVCALAAAGMSTGAVVGGEVVVADLLGGELVALLDVVEPPTGGSSPPDEHPTKASATPRPDAAYARTEPTVDPPQ